MEMKTHLFNDLPLDGDNYSVDKLNFQEYAYSWSKSIYKAAISSNNFVFSIEGPWGSGKTSMANFIKAELKGLICQNHITPEFSKIKVKENGERYIIGNKESGDEYPFISISEFSPWKISSLDSIMIEFFKLLIKGTSLEKEKKIKKALSNIIHISSPLASATPLVSLDKSVAKITDMISDSLTNDSLETSYYEVS
ncbi:MAG: P-loop NTPase fold protein, partial [Rothia sp. (in: high G+C Gram-positive bacteria)]|nr:P-loop NTPase fold protein [Rothia sp. (in: high G+C Gram-positive bacteria)]